MDLLSYQSICEGRLKPKAASSAYPFHRIQDIYEES